MPRQLGQANAGSVEHGDDRVIPALYERPALATPDELLQFVLGEDRHEFLIDLGRAELCGGVGKLLLSRPPLEELLDGPVLVVGVRVAVAVEQPDHPALNVLPFDFLPVGVSSLTEQMLSSEPLRRLDVGAYGLVRLPLGREVQPERVDRRLERACGELLGLPGALRPMGIVSSLPAL